MNTCSVYLEGREVPHEKMEGAEGSVFIKGLGMTPRRPSNHPTIERTWPLVLLLASLVLLLAACSGDVSGNVYVTMKSGDVKRGADVEVGLVREQFMPEWTKARTTFKSSYQQARSAYEEASARADRAHEEYIRDIGSRFRDGRADDEARERAAEAARRVDAVKKAWIDHTEHLAKWAMVKVSRTDVNGRYEFKGVPRGKYYVLASHKIFDNDLFWLVPVEVRSASTVDLSNSNSSSPLDLILNEDKTTKAMTAPVSPPAAPREKTHQPKWLVEQLAKEKREAQERQEGRETKGAETKASGTWRLLQTVFTRRVSDGGKLEDALNDVLRNTEQFQSQAVVASSLSWDECRRVASQTANAARTWHDKKYDQENGVALVRSDRQAADTSGWTTRPRIEESVTVQVWSCGDTAREAKSR